MKKISLFNFLSFLLLFACAPAITSAPPSTEVFIPSSTIMPTPSFEPISGGWSTFYNPEFGFSLQYPAIYDKGFQSFEFICDISVVESNSKNLHIVIGDILVDGEQTNKSLAEYVNYYIDNNRQGWDVEQTQIEINGLIAKELEYHQKRPPRSGNVTIIVKENKAIVIQHFDTNFVNCDLKDDGYSSYWVYDQIVNSLKFQQ